MRPQDIYILVGCEESQAVTIALRDKGINAFSCDIEECTGGHNEWHLKMDLFEAVSSRKWNAGIFFPPCTHLAVSGAKHFAKKIADGRQQQGIDFFMSITELNMPYAIENPVGIMSSKFRKPDQIIQPWQFGDEFQKTTCLWISGLPLLKHTEIVSKGDFVTTPSGKRLPKWYSDNKSAANRSKTFPGIAKAMADQWGDYLINDTITVEASISAYRQLTIFDVINKTA